MNGRLFFASIDRDGETLFSRKRRKEWRKEFEQREGGYGKTSRKKEMIDDPSETEARIKNLRVAVSPFFLAEEPCERKLWPQQRERSTIRVPAPRERNETPPRERERERNEMPRERERGRERKRKRRERVQRKKNLAAFGLSLLTCFLLVLHPLKGYLSAQEKRRRRRRLYRESSPRRAPCLLPVAFFFFFLVLFWMQMREREKKVKKKKRNVFISCSPAKPSPRPVALRASKNEKNHLLFWKE